MGLTTERLSIATEGCETKFQSALSDQETYKEKHKSLMNKVDNNLKEINNGLKQIKALLKIS